MSIRMCILIVDDIPEMARTLADVLELQGYEVYAVSSGVEALKVLQAHPVDILLTDVKMPGMNGVELYMETQKIHPNLYTIFMTAYAVDDLIKRGLFLGIKTVLTKPLNMNLVLTMFESIYKILHSDSDPGRRETPTFIKGW
jgi:CheY-like chemotaxis protein